MTSKIFSPDPSNLQRYSSQFSSLGNDYVFSRISKNQSITEITSHSMRLGGMTLVLCLNGSIELDVNLESFKLCPNDLIIAGHDSVFSVRNVDWHNLDAYVFIISSEFIRDIKYKKCISGKKTDTTSERKA